MRRQAGQVIAIDVQGEGARSRRERVVAGSVGVNVGAARQLPDRVLDRISVLVAQGSRGCTVRGTVITVVVFWSNGYTLNPALLKPG